MTIDKTLFIYWLFKYTLTSMYISIKKSLRNIVVRFAFCSFDLDLVNDCISVE